MDIYSTLSHEKENLVPINENKINMFVCGPTVYDDAHIGHGRTYVAFDTIKRFLEYLGYSVFYIQNITDVDDKIINRSKETGIPTSDIAKKYEKRYIEDMNALNVNNVNLFARATDHMAEIIDQIERLMEKGYAYETEDGVYFEIAKFKDFGKLSHINVNELQSHRELAKSTKKNKNDFVLWKKRDDPSEPRWNSPWGMGRPGWHIEDTAITEYYFGSQYDIHGGGIDLIFPHHEAEITQMEAVSGKSPMVKYWLHTGFLMVSGEKMSKSLKNFITIRDLLKDFDGDVIRFFILNKHYRSKIDFSHKVLVDAGKGLERIKKYYELVSSQLADKNGNASADYEIVLNIKKEFIDCMSDDFNTPQAIASVFKLINESKKDILDEKLDESELAAIREFLDDVSYILGINFQKKEDSSKDKELFDLIADIRTELRANKQYELSDKIREKLVDLGYEISD